MCKCESHEANDSQVDELARTASELLFARHRSPPLRPPAIDARPLVNAECRVRMRMLAWRTWGEFVKYQSSTSG